MHLLIHYQDLIVFCHTYFRLTFSSQQIVDKIWLSFCFWASDPLIDWFYLSNKGSESQKQRRNKISWTIWFDEKICLMYWIYCWLPYSVCNKYPSRITASCPFGIQISVCTLSAFLCRKCIGYLKKIELLFWVA